MFPTEEWRSTPGKHTTTYVEILFSCSALFQACVLSQDLVSEHRMFNKCEKNWHGGVHKRKIKDYKFSTSFSDFDRIIPGLSDPKGFLALSCSQAFPAFVRIVRDNGGRDRKAKGRARRESRRHIERQERCLKPSE